MESVKIISIRGVTSGQAAKLATAGVKHSLDLLNRAGTTAQLEALAKETGIAKAKLLGMVQQADLLRVPGISVDDADTLLRVGIANVQALAAADPAALSSRIVEYRAANPKPSYELPTLNELQQWKGVAKTIVGAISAEAADASTGSGATGGPGAPSAPEAVGTASSFFVDMSEMILQLGVGISQAQQALDRNALDTQSAINADESLRGTGLGVTWYAIPEATLDLKMDYSVVKEESSEGTATRIRISPINAKYRNFFKVSEAVQSQLQVKFATVPPPQRVTESIPVPDVIGRTTEQAAALLKDSGLRLGAVTFLAGAPSSGASSEVKSQSPKGGSDARFLDEVGVEVVKRKE